MKFKDDDMLSSWKYILPLGLIVLLLPLVVRLKTSVAIDVARAHWKDQEYYIDFFSYHKGKFLIVLAVLAFFYMCYALILENIILKKHVIYLPMAIYTILVVLSAGFSNYRGLAVSGLPESNEGMVMICVYMLLMFMAINLLNSKKSIVIIFSFLLISSIITCIIGISQFFGYDVFYSYIGKILIMPKAMVENGANITTTKGLVYSTLSSPSSLGVYLTMILPLVVSLIVYCKDKKYKLLFSFIFILNFITLIACDSRAGVLGFGISMIVYLITRFKTAFKGKNPLILLGISILIVGTFIGGSLLTGNKLVNRMNVPLVSNKTTIKDITLEDKNKVKLTYENSSILFTLNEKFEVNFTDEQGANIAHENSNGNITFKDTKFSNLKLSMKRHNESPVITLSEDTFNIGFILDNGTLKYLALDTLKAYDIDKVKTSEFVNKKLLGTERGYIWSRTLPMLKDTLFLGKGPDLFALYFPKNDFIGKANAFSSPTTMIDDTHNFYLETVFNTGFLSLIAFLAIVIMYILKSFKLYFNKDLHDLYSIAGFGIFISVTAYLAASFFNDSNLSTAPIFWILLGCGVSINMKLDKQTKNNLL